MNERNCSNCHYFDCDDYDYPCVECKNTVCPSNAEYYSRPFLWVGEKPMESNDSVNHPSHYNKGKIEVWDFISDWKLNFDRGNAIKYICRAGSKDPEKEIQDLEKAIEYINHEIKMLKGESENA